MLKLDSQSDEPAVIRANHIVVAFLGRERLYALAIFAHTIEVVVGVDRMKKAILARLGRSVAIGRCRRIRTARLEPEAGG